MNARKMRTLAVVLICGSIALEGSARAEETGEREKSEKVSCYTVTGGARDTWPGAGNVSTGVVARTRIIDGRTQYVYDTEGFPTPDPEVVTFGAELTITTKRGLVKARVLFLFGFVTGTWTSIATLDPASSTGRFAGATGTLWFPRGATIDREDGAQTYPSDITGYVCLAR